MSLWLTQSQFIHGLKRMFLGSHPALSFRRVYLSVYFSFFESHSWTVHPCIQGIYPSMLVCLSWIILDECIKEWRILIQLCTYLKIHHIYIWKSKLMQTFVHRYGTCSRASVLGNKNTQTRPRIAQKWNTNVLSWGLLKHSKHKIVNTHEKANFHSSRYLVPVYRPECGAIIHW